ncbi:MAG: glycoside hydrolase family 3 N-terminal domain-containing protein [Acidimicrobiales bacterium]
MSITPTNGDALRRMAAATLMASFTGPVVPDWLRRAADDGLGGVCLFASNLTGPARGVTDALHAVRPELIVATDEEGGDVTRLWAASGSPIPGNAALGAVDDPALTRQVAAALGVALAANGVDLDLAPVADVNVDPANPVIGVRSFGADPTGVARQVAAFVAGLQASGVAACAKHFPGHGATSVDSHLDRPVLDISHELLGRRELMPFRAAVEAGTAAVMTGHVVVPALDDRPATVSPVVVDLLRSELGFTGAVVTDALDMAGAGGPAVIPMTVVAALSAGADLCCLGPDATADLVAACIDAVVAAVQRGGLEADRLAEAAHRVAGVRRSSAMAAAPAIGPDLVTIGLDAARRGVRVDGDPAVAPGAHVIELAGPDMIAAGPVPWGLGPALADLDPTVTHARDATAPAPPPRRPLVIAYRDAHRHRELRATLERLAAARPDAVLVDMGWPHPNPPPTRGRIVTFGAAPPCALAAAELLVPARRTTHHG